MTLRRTIRLGLGIGQERAGWAWAGRLRCWLSYNLQIGEWFYFREICEDCGGQADDVDYSFQRTGFHRARCMDRGACEYEVEGTDG